MTTGIPKEIAVLRAISEAIVRERDVRRLLNEVIDILDREMGMLRGTIALLEGDELRIEASDRMLNAEERALGRYRIGEGITGTVARTGRAEVVADVRKDSRFLNKTRSRGKNEALSFICVPLIHLGQVIGTLSVDRRIGAGAKSLDGDLALLEIVANITADAAAKCREEFAERENLRKENRRLRGMLADAPGRLVGQCREMRAVYAQIRQLAPGDAPVLVRGSGGTGKELVARAIHDLSLRKDGPFVALNCSAPPDALAEPGLPGRGRDAPADARRPRSGFFGAADGGTLFLDEIGDLPAASQAKLLNLLARVKSSRAGSGTRIIAATSRDLEGLIAKRLFREDLYKLLCAHSITLPDLRDRQDDILLLARHFLAKTSARYGKNVSRFSDAVVAILQSYGWPGNVRELEDCIERAVLTASDDCVRTYNLPLTMQSKDFEDDKSVADRPQTLGERLAAAERRILADAVARHGGNRSAAGRELGVSPRMMNYRMKKTGLSHPGKA